jgi:uridine phosphorylase
MPIHLRNSMPIAPDVLLPGDPGRAMAMAQALIASPKMHNLHRGLWGYTGETIDELGGRPLSIQSTGMGAPSAAIVIHELAELGARRAIRVGTCGALDPALELGQLLRVDAALGDTGVNRAVAGEASPDGPISPDAGLTGRLENAGAGAPVTVATSDLFYEDAGASDAREGWIAAGAGAVDMETAALFALGPGLGISVACLMVVSDVFGAGGRERIGEAALEEAVGLMGRVAAEALSA